jgi:putative SOS response-associated peptidase YedK
MCNEWYWKLVNGEWRWVRGRRPEGHRNPKDAPPQPDLFAVFPDRLAPVIAKAKDGEPEWREMRWGFPPPSVGARIVTNVRNTASGFWRNWLDPKWRVVVPFDLFVEFTDTTPKRKHYFSVTDNEPAAFAGIWRPWSGVRGTKAEPVEGDHHLFAILTTEANDLVRPIHSKAMPVLLSGEEAQRAWLEMPVEDALAVQANAFAPERMRVT